MPASRMGRYRPVVLVAHGSRDPRATASTRDVVRAVAAARPGLDVRAAFLEHAQPRPAQVLAAVAGAAPPVVVPLLLTSAYHGRVDLPTQVAGFDCDVTPTLGCAEPVLLDALALRLGQAVPLGYDALVLAAAGTRVVAARAEVEQVAAALSRRVRVPVQVAYATAAQPSGADAVRLLRDRGAARVAVCSYFLAHGRLFENVAAETVGAGAVAVAAPIGAAPELVRLVLARIDEASDRELDRVMCVR